MARLEISSYAAFGLMVSLLCGESQPMIGWKRLGIARLWRGFRELSPRLVQPTMTCVEFAAIRLTWDLLRNGIADYQIGWLAHRE